MTASNSSTRKDKGRKLQKQVVDLFTKAFPQLDGNIFWRSMGASGTDVYFSRDFNSEFPFAIECKAQESLNIWSALQQAADNTSALATIPLLFFKRSRSRTYVCLEANDFMDILKRCVDG